MSKPDYFGSYLGYRVIPPKSPQSLITVEMTIEQKHLSSAGVAHGGAVFSLVDFALGAALFLEFKAPGQSCSTVGMSIEYLAPIPLGATLTVTPVIEHKGHSIARLRADVNDQNGTKVAFAIGTFNLYQSKKIE